MPDSSGRFKGISVPSVPWLEGKSMAELNGMTMQEIEDAERRVEAMKANAHFTPQTEGDVRELERRINEA